MTTWLELPQFFLQIEPSFPKGWDAFLSNLAVAAVLGIVLYIGLFFVLNWLFRRLDNQVGILSLSVARGPILILFALTSLTIAFGNLQEWEPLVLVQKLLRGLIVLTLSYLLAQLFTEVLAYFLKKYAEKSEARSREWHNAGVSTRGC